MALDRAPLVGRKRLHVTAHALARAGRGPAPALAELLEMTPALLGRRLTPLLATLFAALATLLDALAVLLDALAVLLDALAVLLGAFATTLACGAGIVRKRGHRGEQEGARQPRSRDPKTAHQPDPPSRSR